MNNNLVANLDLRYYVYYSADDIVFYRRVFKSKASANRFINSLRGTIYHVSDCLNFYEEVDYNG